MSHAEHNDVTFFFFLTLSDQVEKCNEGACSDSSAILSAFLSPES